MGTAAKICSDSRSGNAVKKQFRVSTTVCSYFHVRSYIGVCTWVDRKCREMTVRPPTLAIVQPLCSHRKIRGKRGVECERKVCFAIHADYKIDDRHDDHGYRTHKEYE